MRNLLLAVIAAAPLLTGCLATAVHVDQPRPQSRELTVDISRDPIYSAMTKPIGATFIPESQVYVLSSQKGLRLAGLFGVLGLMVADAANQTSVESDTTRKLQINLAETVHDAMSHAAQADGGQALQFGSTDRMQRIHGQAIVVRPGIALMKVSDTDFRPYVMLHAVREGGSEVDRWQFNVAGLSEQARPLTGSGSWTEGNLLQMEVEQLARELASTLVEEMTVGLPRSPLMQATIRLQAPWSTDVRDVTAAYLDEYKGRKLVYTQDVVAYAYLMPDSLLEARNAKPWVRPPSASGASVP